MPVAWKIFCKAFRAFFIRALISLLKENLNALLCNRKYEFLLYWKKWMKKLKNVGPCTLQMNREVSRDNEITFL
jgi:hypothetical protein